MITLKSAHGITRTSLRRVCHPAWALEWVPKTRKNLFFFSFFPHRPSPRVDRWCGVSTLAVCEGRMEKGRYKHRTYSVNSKRQMCISTYTYLKIYYMLMWSSYTCLFSDKHYYLHLFQFVRVYGIIYIYTHTYMYTFIFINIFMFVYEHWE